MKGHNRSKSHEEKKDHWLGKIDSVSRQRKVLFLEATTRGPADHLLATSQLG
jgi:hypothetical protein